MKSLSYVIQVFGVVLAILGFGGDLSGGPSVYDQTAGFPASFIAWGIGAAGVGLFMLGRRMRERRTEASRTAARSGRTSPNRATV